MLLEAAYDPNILAILLLLHNDVFENYCVNTLLQSAFAFCFFALLFLQRNVMMFFNYGATNLVLLHTYHQNII